MLEIPEGMTEAQYLAKLVAEDLINYDQNRDQYGGYYKAMAVMGGAEVAQLFYEMLVATDGDSAQVYAYAHADGDLLDQGVPLDIQNTLDRIKAGQPYPHRNDGTEFYNRESLLPARSSGYYTEYVHPSPGIRGPGPQRVVIGKGGEIYYTPDHYRTFIRIDGG